MTTTIRRNADGRHNITDLRAALVADRTVEVFRVDAQWCISRWSDAMEAWIEHPCHMLDDERTVICRALGIDPHAV